MNEVFEHAASTAAQGNGRFMFGLSILRGLQDGRPVYGGTVPGAEKARRRAKGKAAKAARKVNR